jgi:hypothetical protein
MRAVPCGSSAAKLIDKNGDPVLPIGLLSEYCKGPTEGGTAE